MGATIAEEEWSFQAECTACRWKGTKIRKRNRYDNSGFAKANTEAMSHNIDRHPEIDL